MVALSGHVVVGEEPRARKAAAGGVRPAPRALRHRPRDAPDRDRGLPRARRGLLPLSRARARSALAKPARMRKIRRRFARGSDLSRHRVLRKTKVIATIGPACDSPETIKAMIRAGMNVARLNFSHGTHEEHRKRLGVIRQASDELRRERRDHARHQGRRDPHRPRRGRRRGARDRRPVHAAHRRPRGRRPRRVGLLPQAAARRSRPAR